MGNYYIAESLNRGLGDLSVGGALPMGVHKHNMELPATMHNTGLR